MKKYMVSTLCAALATFALQAGQTSSLSDKNAKPMAEKKAKDSATYRGPMKDQDDTSDIFAIPLDDSEEGERQEEAALQAQAKREQAKRLAKEQCKKEAMEKSCKPKDIPK
jgi:hypothetical protein